VAWFTANRTATINTGAFGVVKTDGTLAVEVTNGVGTVVTNTTVSRVTDAKIADVSFNPKTHQLYTDKGNGDVSGYREIGGTTSFSTAPTGGTGTGAHAYKIDDKTYYAFTWSVTLTYTWGPDKTPLNVFFDYKNSSMSTTSAAETDSGLRIAMAATKTVVFAGMQATAGNLKGVYGTAANNFEEYGTTNITGGVFGGYFAQSVYGDSNTASSNATATKTTYSQALDGDTQSVQIARPDFLGTIEQEGEETNSDIVINCIAWYEGTDPNVVNNKSLGEVSSTLAFYATTQGE